MRSTVKISPVRENVKKINSDKLTLSLGRISLLIIGRYIYNQPIKTDFNCCVVLARPSELVHIKNSMT